ncbi:hypothetical protein ASPACDRAFT_63206 [Aspergillus aculeatus ATCC 16872]|uniref:Uncharacterized protein n=1 Tax=Aspergillus aculeatus (strain ATCC 16872 / CBS 172.66 / WB 5094) TaxID=690307 RepID=A0A1L9WL51_ASPA1|nr:uncharacterized protein ASPACDRAFT_63206 [Aspergillus aculeatus ATCC 16872]OJJ96886.1 hypothetical protein ASPACDRAFT_63206 [Aspergillus aculeatus ATCC 16872]
MSWGSNPLGLQEQFGVPGFVSSGQARPGDWQMRLDTNPFHRRPVWTPVDGPGGLELPADDGCGRVVTATASIQGDMGLTRWNPLGGSVTAYANRMGDMQTTNWNGYGGMVTASANRAGALRLTGITLYGSASAEMNTFSSSYSVDARSFCDRQWVMGAAGGFGFSSPGAGGSSFFGAPNTNGFLLQSRNPAASSGSGESEEVLWDTRESFSTTISWCFVSRVGRLSSNEVLGVFLSYLLRFYNYVYVNFHYYASERSQ